MAIRELHISGYSRGDNSLVRQTTEPSEKILNLSVINGVAFLDVQNLEHNGDLSGIEASIKVPAKSLVRAVQTLIDDEEED